MKGSAPNKKDAGLSPWAAFKQSLSEAAGDIVFGTVNGTVSIFGLVAGVAASSTTSNPVVLAGATGAVAAAVSMAAGVFLDVQTSRGIAKAALDHERQEIQDDLDAEKQEIRDRLIAQGFDTQDKNSIIAILGKELECAAAIRSRF